ncbi:MAG: hypothetical protein ACYDBB_26015 [Armatimonadota bacterium]
MKILSILIAVITGLLLSSTAICGLWIKANKVTDASSITFHMNIGIATLISGLIAVVLLIVLAVKR